MTIDGGEAVFLYVSNYHTNIVVDLQRRRPLAQESAETEREGREAGPAIIITAKALGQTTTLILLKQGEQVEVEVGVREDRQRDRQVEGEIRGEPGVSNGEELIRGG